MKLPLLLHVLENGRKATKTEQVLKAFNFRIREINNYPYFNLEVGR
jgi:hypothetical protein